MIAAIRPFHICSFRHATNRFRYPAVSMASLSSSSDTTRPISAQASNSVHPIAEQGFNADQSLYESARPSYPPSVVDYVKSELVPELSHLETAKEMTILDLAAGTGKWTRLLAPLGIGRLIAIDPSPGMRSELERQALSPDWPSRQSLEILDGSATSIPFPECTFDTIFVAQAFHWFANVPSLTEMHRVLKPGGSVILIWNLEDKTTPWVAQLRDLYEKFEGGSPQYRLGLWRKPFEEEESLTVVSRLFNLPYVHKQFTHVVVNTFEGVYQRALSKSYISLLGEPEKIELKEQFAKVFESPGFPWHEREGKGGGREKVVDVPLTTDVISFKKR